MKEQLRSRLNERLRRPPFPHSVPGSLPILFFGDLFSARIATIGLNPSDQEYTTGDGVLLGGAARRLATLASLGVADRTSLTAAQCDEAIAWMRRYFDAGKPVYGPYFRHLEHLLAGFGASLANGTATHLDLVQEATHPTWSELRKANPGEYMSMLAADVPFLEWQIRSYPFQAVICTGKTVSEHVRALLDVTMVETGSIGLIDWWVGFADLDGRRISVAGWNRPLHRATGLGTVGEHRLGTLLRQRVRVWGFQALHRAVPGR